MVEVELVVDDVDGFGVDDPVWDVPWLADLVDVPATGTWPRLMTVPHPDAVGSYGVEAEAWLTAEAGISLRWWQRLSLRRKLEHDAAGELVWLDVLETTARQVGKSTDLRASATWRLHQAPLFGEEQTIMHTGKDLPVCKEVQRHARAWAKTRGYPVREQNGNEQITEPESGSRWMVRSTKSVYGYPSSAILVDEAWGVGSDVVEDGLEPTMAERCSPQMTLASTAHRKATSLFPDRRRAALAELGAPASTLLMEWSAPAFASIEDRAAWRMASPHWSRTRERLLEAKLARVRQGQSVDEDEDDPIESFRSQFLNIWPARSVTGVGELLIPSPAWKATAGEVPDDADRVWIGLEDNAGDGAAVTAAVRLDDGRIGVDGWLRGSWTEAVDDVRLLAAGHERYRLFVGASLMIEVPTDLVAKKAGTMETRTGLPLLRQLAAAGELVHQPGDLDEQIAALRVTKTAGGALAVIGGVRWDLVRALCWVVQAAHHPVRVPAIR